ncbi:Glioma tumor suppressor candidate region gene 1 protein [Portunus trituberculatus]|uniref:Glioma tumor suppressor candidate region gene 1 protein n=1 Tax=Portunus trituberculatus TaxID=210409 RepID=A0A5B7E8J8_PORTR|nr:Glioma tumor suppressor candidate region gene 1 protein [Portunus trituberculatus]
MTSTSATGGTGGDKDNGGGSKDESGFEHQLKTDQNGALNPDYRTPFKNKIDACKRLIRYHVFNECAFTPWELAESNAQYELQAETLLKKFNNMKYKYQSLLVKDSMHWKFHQVLFTMPVVRL